MKGIKVLLFSPELLERTYPGRPPIYYLSNYLRRHGIAVKTIDVDIAGRKNFAELVKSFEPDVIGGTSLSIQINEAMNLMEISKKLRPMALTILGGVHATVAGEYLYPVHAKYLDAVVIGDGQQTLLEIVRVVENRKWEQEKGNIRGLLLWDDKNTHLNSQTCPADINDLIPDIPYDSSYDFQVFAKSDGSLRKTFQFTTTLGCKNTCFFCSSSVNLHGEKRKIERRMNRKTVESILKQASKRGYEAVYFDDDTFTRDPEHAMAVARLAKKYRLYFGCHTRPDCETPEIIKALADNGCGYIFSGLESAVDGILLGVNKTHDPRGYREAYLQSYRHKKKLGIPASAFMIHGLPKRVGPGEYVADSLEDSMISLDFSINELDPAYLSMNVLRFLPGVPLSYLSQFEFMRPVEGILHGGYFDKKWLQANGKNDPKSFHPILRAFEGSGSPIPTHMTPQRCHDILAGAVEMVNVKNSKPGKNQTRIVVDPWFEQKYIKTEWKGGKLSYQLASLEEIERNI